MSKKPGAAKRAGPGRPSAYRDEFPELARKFCLLGATGDQLAQMFDVSSTTIDTWMATKPEFADAVKAGKRVADATVADSLYRSACGYEHESEEIHVVGKQIVRVPIIKKYPPHPTSMIFWLKNRDRANWRDKVDVEHNTPLRSLSDEKLEAALAAVEQALKGQTDDTKPNGTRPTLQ